MKTRKPSFFARLTKWKRSLFFRLTKWRKSSKRATNDASDMEAKWVSELPSPPPKHPLRASRLDLRKSSQYSSVATGFDVSTVDGAGLRRRLSIKRSAASSIVPPLPKHPPDYQRTHDESRQDGVEAGLKATIDPESFPRSSADGSSSGYARETSSIPSPPPKQHSDQQNLLDSNSKVDSIEPNPAVQTVEGPTRGRTKLPSEESPNANGRDGRETTLKPSPPPKNPLRALSPAPHIPRRESQLTGIVAGLGASTAEPSPSQSPQPMSTSISSSSSSLGQASTQKNISTLVLSPSDHTVPAVEVEASRSQSQLSNHTSVSSLLLFENPAFDSSNHTISFPASEIDRSTAIASLPQLRLSTYTSASSLSLSQISTLDEPSTLSPPLSQGSLSIRTESPIMISNNAAIPDIPTDEDDTSNSNYPYQPPSPRSASSYYSSETDDAEGRYATEPRASTLSFYSSEQENAVAEYVDEFGYESVFYESSLALREGSTYSREDSERDMRPQTASSYYSSEMDEGASVRGIRNLSEEAFSESSVHARRSLSIPVIDGREGMEEFVRAQDSNLGCGAVVQGGECSILNLNSL